MSASTDRFSRIASVRVLPDRRSSAVCGGPFLVMTSKSRTSARLTPQSSTVVALSRTGRAGWREGN